MIGTFHKITGACILGLMIALTAAPIPASAQAAEAAQAFFVGDLDSSLFVLTVPRDWKVEPKRWPLTLEMSPGKGEDFKFLITVLGVPKERRSILEPGNVRAAAQRNAERVKAQAAEA